MNQQKLTTQLKWCLIVSAILTTALLALPLVMTDPFPATSAAPLSTDAPILMRSQPFTPQPNSTYNLNVEDTSTQARFWDTPLQSGALASFEGQRLVIPGSNDQIRVIVQMRDDPISVYMKRTFGVSHRLTNAEAAVMQQYADSLSVKRREFLSQIQQQGISVKVSREFVYLLNGFALSVKMGDWGSIEDLPQIKSIYPDYEMHIDLRDSVPLIGAPSVWAMTDASGMAITGQGVRVAIIDTGVDYTHPDLGGCLGPGCKAVGAKLTYKCQLAH